ncbi:MAG: ParB N-terminal domain-containing protein [Promethearchaeota archaeon]
MAQDRFYSERPLVHQHIVLLNIDELYGHEETVQNQVGWLKDNLKNLGHFFRPILVVKNENVILDGHHRVVALKELGEERNAKVIKIPCVEIEYVDNPDIKLGTWHPFYTEKGPFNFPFELKKMSIEWDEIENFSRDILKNPKYGFTLMTNNGKYYCLNGTQQAIYQKFLANFNPTAFDYAKTIDFAIHSIENDKGSFALLRTRVTKEDVIKAAKEKRLYAPKTTRHILSFRYQDIKVPLETLFQP